MSARPYRIIAAEIAAYKELGTTPRPRFRIPKPTEASLNRRRVPPVVPSPPKQNNAKPEEELQKINEMASMAHEDRVRKAREAMPPLPTTWGPVHPLDGLPATKATSGNPSLLRSASLSSSIGHRPMSSLWGGSSVGGQSYCAREYDWPEREEPADPYADYVLPTASAAIKIWERKSFVHEPVWCDCDPRGFFLAGRPEMRPSHSRQSLRSLQSLPASPSSGVPPQSPGGSSRGGGRGGSPLRSPTRSSSRSRLDRSPSRALLDRSPRSARKSPRALVTSSSPRPRTPSLPPLGHDGAPWQPSVDPARPDFNPTQSAMSGCDGGASAFGEAAAARPLTATSSIAHLAQLSATPEATKLRRPEHKYRKAKLDPYKRVQRIWEWSHERDARLATMQAPLDASSSFGGA